MRSLVKIALLGHFPQLGQQGGNIETEQTPANDSDGGDHVDISDFLAFRELLHSNAMVCIPKSSIPILTGYSV